MDIEVAAVIGLGYLEVALLLMFSVYPFFLVKRYLIDD